MSDLSLIERGFDELPAEIAIIDSHGDIIYTNRAWGTFAEANGYDGDVDAIGVNYLDVCDDARGESETAGIVADGIRALLSGHRDLFTIEYPCHSPTVYRWFTMQAVPFDTPRHGRFVILMHHDITERRLAELQVNEKNQHLRLFARTLSKELKDPLASATEAAERLATQDAPDASELLELLSQIDAIIEQTMTLADQTSTLKLSRVDFRQALETAWEDVERRGDTELRITSDGTLSADSHLFGLLANSLLANSIERCSLSGYPTKIVAGVTNDGFYVADDGPHPSDEERLVTMGENQILGVDYDSVELSVVRRIADLHDWHLSTTDSDLGGARFEVSGVTWL